MRKPLSQGDLDGFCGLYSIINAVSLLFPSRMNEDARSDLFKIIATACPAKWPEVLWNGTNVHDVRAMLDAAKIHLAGIFKWEQPFAHVKMADFETFSRELTWRIKGDDAFAIVGISKPWEHWTCTHRLTPRVMIMTDSCRVKQIPRAKCGLTGDDADYCFDYHQTFVLFK